MYPDRMFREVEENLQLMISESNYLDDQYSVTAILRIYGVISVILLPLVFLAIQISKM
jgi:hypothetical protein